MVGGRDKGFCLKFCLSLAFGGSPEVVEITRLAGDGGVGLPRWLVKTNPIRGGEEAKTDVIVENYEHKCDGCYC